MSVQIGQINNNEDGLSVRNKLNEAISTVETFDNQSVIDTDDTAMQASNQTLNNWLQQFYCNIKWLFDRFNPTIGHTHNGTDSKKIVYSDLTNALTVDSQTIKKTGNVLSVDKISEDNLTTKAKAGMCSAVIELTDQQEIINKSDNGDTFFLNLNTAVQNLECNLSQKSNNPFGLEPNISVKILVRNTSGSSATLNIGEVEAGNGNITFAANETKIIYVLLMDATKKYWLYY